MSALQILHYMKKEEKKPEIEIVADMGANIPWKPMV